MSPSGPPAQLIVDVGMHRGDDTDFYLRKGFEVLAVEASPHLVEQARVRFSDAIAEGRLTVLNVAMADHEGDTDFYVSEDDLWSSTRQDLADRGYVPAREKVTVPCTTLDRILAGCPTPYYVKVDIEGNDRHCIDALGRLPQKPRFVSFEVDLVDASETEAMLSMLERYGYRDFKLVNQVTHPRELPNPPLEGVYVDAGFTKHMSGPFGEETPGPWRSLEEVRQRYHTAIRHQAARIEYAFKGTVFGIPLGRFHRPLMWTYNTRPVTWVRAKYARQRGVEIGGWFDVHARL